jgi:type I restriction enzyme R subunit
MAMLVREDVYMGEVFEGLQRLGWGFREEISNRRVGDFVDWVLFEDVFREINGLKDEVDLRRRGLSSGDVGEILGYVRHVLSTASAPEVLRFLRDGFYWRVRGSVLEFKLVDYDVVSRNRFTFAREPLFPGRRVDSKPDFVLYVNGIPLVVVEVKSGVRAGGLEEALRQIARYEVESPELFRFVQLAVAYVGRGESVYRATLPNYQGVSRFTPYSRWCPGEGVCDIFDLLEPGRLLEVIRWYTFFRGGDEKVIARYNQWRASEEAYKLIRGYLVGGSGDNRGLVWHWQGSGKTYTMFFIAYRFFKTFFDRDPVVLFIVDRRELARQLYNDFISRLGAPGFMEYVRVVESIEELRELLERIKGSEESGGVTRGVYIVLVQKFRPDALEGLKPITRREVLLLIDEAHRSQYGVLASTINKILPNAIRIAFTGTPVFKFERNTFKLFAYPERGMWYLDRYFIGDSIRDGYTLPIVYQVAVEKGAKILVEEREIRELVEQWLRVSEEVGSIDEMAEEEPATPTPMVTVDEIRKRLNRIKAILENDERLRMLARYIAERVEEDTEGFKYKAMVVAASRRACVRLWKHLVEELRSKHIEGVERWVEVVMTYTENDPEEIREFRRGLQRRWLELSDIEAVNREIQYRFKNEEYPRILIVTDMLITGFDCPALKVMYLDKPLYEHRLLQAIARVNRPYKTGDGDKQFGLVVDTIGLLDHVRKTILTYETIGDATIASDMASNALSSLDRSYEEFRELLGKLKATLRNGVVAGAHRVSVDLEELLAIEDEGVLKRVLEERVDPALRLLALAYSEPHVYEVVELMRRVTRLYEALGAHPAKVDHRREYKIILYMYERIRSLIRGVKLPEEFWDSILKLVHEKTVISPFQVVREEKVGAVDELDLRAVYAKLTRAGLQPSHHTVSEAFLSIRSFLELNIANPLYKHIYEHVKRLEREWLERAGVDSVEKLLEVYRELLSHIEESKAMSLEQRIAHDVRALIEKRYGVRVELPRTREALGLVVREYSGGPLLEKHVRELKRGLLMDIARSLKVEAREKARLVEEIVEGIARMLQDEVGGAGKAAS